jgi:DNA-binding NarL/FixJ family response regulator
MQTFHLLVVSDNHLLAEAVAEALQQESEITSYEFARCGDQHAHLRRTDLEPQLVIIDACCVDDNQRLFTTTNRLAEELPESHIVVLAYRAERDCVTGCIESGAAGFILKTESLAEVVATVRALKQGQARCCSKVSDLVLAKIRELAHTKVSAANQTEADLTEREIEVLQLVETGLLNKEIASRLGLQLSTVKNHLSSVFQKLHVNNRRQAVSQAIAAGILQCQSAPALR